MTQEEMTYMEMLFKKYCAVYEKNVLTIDEAALFLGLEKSYLYKLTSQNKIPFYKPQGKMCYFCRQELEAWALQNRMSTIDEISQKAKSYCRTHKAI